MKILNNFKFSTFILVVLFLLSATATAAPATFDGDKPAATYSSTYSQAFNTAAGWDAAKFYAQWTTVGPNCFSSSDITSGYLAFQWSPKRIMYSNSTYTAPYTFQTNIDYVRGNNRGGVVIRYVQTHSSADDQLQVNGSGGVFNRAGIAFYPKDANDFFIQFSGAEAGTSTLQTRITVPKPAGITSLLTGKNTLRIEDFGSTVYVYMNENPFVRIDLSGLVSGVYTSGTVYDANLVLKGTFSNMVVPTSGMISVAQRSAALSLYDVSINYNTPGTFDGDKPAATYNTTYSQAFNTTAGWDAAKFYAQWTTVMPNCFSSSDITNGYLAFHWDPKRVMYSYSTYTTPYTFETNIDYARGSNRGGVVIRYVQTHSSADDQLQVNGLGGSFNRAGIALYPKDANDFFVQFSGAEAGTSTLQTRITVPKPAGITSLLTGKNTLRIEDFGSTVYVYMNENPFVRIDLSGMVSGVYTSGTVYDANLVSKGTFSNMVVPTSGKISVAQRDAALSLYDVSIKYNNPINQTSTFDNDKPTTAFNTTYSQVFNTWDNSAFHNQWDTNDAAAFTPAIIMSASYMQLTWATTRILRSKSTYSTPYVFSSVLSWNASSTSNGGIIIRAKATGNIENLQEAPLGDGYNREGICFYPTSDYQNLNVQFTGVDNGANTTVTRILVPKPAGITSFKDDLGTFRIEDYGTSIYVYYRGARYIRINLGGLSGGVYTSGTVYDADMVSKGTFTGMEVETAGKVGISQRSSNIRVYRAQLEVPKNIYVSSGTNVSSLLLTTESDIFVSANKLTINAAATVNSITVAPGAQLELTSGNMLSSGTVILQSDATGTATLVDNTTTTPQAVTATVQQYVEAGRNWYMSIPLASGASSLLSRGTSVVCYNEPTSAWIAPAAATLEKLRGYIQVATGSTGTVDFTGVVNTGAHSITLSRTVGQTGFNLVGNPYPSYLDWNLVTRTNVLPTMWFRTKEGGVYKFYTFVANGSAGVGSPATITNKIPPMQAFWVRVNTVGTGSIAVDNNMRSHKDVAGNIMKVPGQTPQKLLRLQISNGVNTDETVLYFNADASDAFDQFDAPKRSNEDLAIPEIYTQVGIEQLVINGMNRVKYNTEIPIGFSTLTAVSNNSLSISAIEISNFETGTRIFLIDKQTIPSIETELTDGGAHSFNAPITTATTGRFSLLFRAPGVATGIDNETKLNAQVFVNAENQITIIAPEKSQYAIYNAMGQLIENGILNNKRHIINCKLNTGVYLVKVANSNSTRLIIK